MIIEAARALGYAFGKVFPRQQNTLRHPRRNRWLNFYRSAVIVTQLGHHIGPFVFDRVRTHKQWRIYYLHNQVVYSTQESDIRYVLTDIYDGVVTRMEMKDIRPGMTLAERNMAWKVISDIRSGEWKKDQAERQAMKNNKAAESEGRSGSTFFGVTC